MFLCTVDLFSKEFDLFINLRARERKKIAAASFSINPQVIILGEDDKTEKMSQQFSPLFGLLPTIWAKMTNGRPAVSLFWGILYSNKQQPHRPATHKITVHSLVRWIASDSCLRTPSKIQENCFIERKCQKNFDAFLDDFLGPSFHDCHFLLKLTKAYFR